MVCDFHQDSESGSDTWASEMIQQGTVALYEMEESKGEFEKILGAFMMGDTTEAYRVLKFLEIRADREQRMVTAGFAFNLRECLQNLKNQNLEKRTVGVFGICRIIRVILHEAEKRSPREARRLASKALQQLVQRTRCFSLVQVA